MFNTFLLKIKITFPSALDCDQGYTACLGPHARASPIHGREGHREEQSLVSWGLCRVTEGRDWALI